MASAGALSAFYGEPVFYILLSLVALHILFTVRGLRQAQKKIQEYDRRFRSTFENAAVGIAHLSLEGRWLMVNPCMCAMTGFSESELLQKGLADLTLPDEFQNVWDQVQGVAEGRLSSYATETRTIHKNQSIIWVKVTVGLKRNLQGLPKYYVLTIDNITAHRALEEERRKIQTALQESEQKYRTLFNNMTEEVHFWQLVRGSHGEILTWRLMDANPPSLQTWSKNLLEIKGKTADQIFGPAAVDHYRPVVEKAVTSRKPVSFEDYYPDHDRYHRFTTIALGDYFITTGADVTQARKAQRLAEQRRFQMEAVFEAVSDGIAVFNMQGEIVILNEALAKINEYPDAASMKKDLSHFAQIYELTDSEDRIIDVQEWPVVKVIKGQSILAWELKGRRKDTGREWHFSFSGAPVYDQSGKQVLAVVITRDITVQKKMEKVLQQSELRFRVYSEEMPQMAFIADSEGDIIYYNQRFYEYTGMDRVLHGWGWKDYPIHHPDDIERTLRTWKKALSTGELYQIEYRLRRYDGQYRWHLGRAVPIRDTNGKIEQWLGTNTDIQDQYEIRTLLQESLDQAKAASEAKSRFLANMSHELRTPMTAVLGFAEILREANLSEEERKDALARIDRSGRALLRLIDDVLDISKIEAGKIQLQKARFSPLELTTEVISLFRPQTEKKEIRIRLMLEPSVPAIAFSDPSRVRQILTNLVGNAVKFTSQGEIRVRVASEAQNLLFEVQDTGIGIALGDQKKLFKAFVQADESITRKYGGTGLGLVLSQRLAEQLGGHLILADSQPGQGSCFRFQIEAGPFEHGLVTPSEGGARKRGEGDTPAPLLTGIRVLLVEDVADNQVLMRRYLEGMQAHVDLASDGREAIQKALSQHYDVVLMDIQLPTMDGIEATRHLRSEGYQRPILALTAHAMAEEVHRSLQAGCVEHLTKPLSKHQLIEAVFRWSRTLSPSFKDS